MVGQDWTVAAETGDFYEEDEPIEDVLAAWKHSAKDVTAPSRRGFNLVLDVGGEVHTAAVGETTMVSSLGLLPERPMFSPG
jgi:hypothetical protein